jgi:hypothetical protein
MENIMIDHDPLCPWNTRSCSCGADSSQRTEHHLYCRKMNCQCDLIAKVREDMLAKCIAAINAIEPYHMQAQLYRREEIDAALRALEEKP